MQLASKIFYQYPDHQLNCCVGITQVLDSLRWVFRPNKGCPIDEMEAPSLERLQQYLVEEAARHKVKLPSAFGTVTRTQFERLHVKNNHITFQYIYLIPDSGKSKNERVHFQFAEHDIASFTKAIASASKVRDCILTIQGVSTRYYSYPD